MRLILINNISSFTGNEIEKPKMYTILDKWSIITEQIFVFIRFSSAIYLGHGATA